MRITESDIIELIVDDLVTGDIGGSTVVIRRVGAGSLSLDYGESGRFLLTVEKRDSNAE
ncbi:MAG TPA: hypothetical protein VFW65_35865 [Pseudonocardiaceae bacterium]|nr:hypothetical protein [Pseudonocardiaceae bacterium]